MGKQNLGRVTSIVKPNSNTQSMSGQLSLKGFSRAPGATVTFSPFMESNGEFRTGLDPNALYIREMALKNEEAAKLEKERVTELLDIIQKRIGSQDISPRSDFYVKMMDGLSGTNERASVASMGNGVTYFNLDDPYSLITFAWLRVHPMVAPSHNAWKEGRCNPSVMFFVDDEDYEAEMIYKDNVERDKATNKMTSLSPEKQLKVARLLGLPVRAGVKPSVVYNELHKFLQDNKTKLNNVKLFTQVAELEDSIINAKYLFEEAIAHNIYRMRGSNVTEGSVVIAKSKEEMIALLCSKKYQEEYLALEAKVAQKKVLEMTS